MLTPSHSLSAEQFNFNVVVRSATTTSLFSGDISAIPEVIKRHPANIQFYGVTQQYYVVHNEYHASDVEMSRIYTSVDFYVV